jgi:hypothetical protein
MSVEIPPMRRSLTGWGGQLQGDERYLLQRIVILERHYAFQQQRPLRFSIRYEWTGSDHDSPCNAKLVRFGGPIIIVKFLKVDIFASLFRLWPR